VFHQPQPRLDKPVFQEACLDAIGLVQTLSLEALFLLEGALSEGLDFETLFLLEAMPLDTLRLKTVGLEGALPEGFSQALVFFLPCDDGAAAATANVTTTTAAP
jgi:hypothetical protein